MDHSNPEKGAKLLQLKVKGQKRPFIDENLQIHIPGQEGPWETGTLHPFSSIYSHYSSQSPTYSLASLVFPVDHTELKHAMAEAEQAYTGWKKMQEKLKKIRKKTEK